MKLEIKHLVGYLPYDLRGLVEWEHKNKTHNVSLYGILENNLKIENPYGGIDYCDLIDFKPLLYPISTINEFREDLGFVVLDKLREVDVNIHFGTSSDFYDDKKRLMFYFYDSYESEVTLEDIISMEEILNKYHIDWKYNLIENNLAIDKRTI